MRPNDLITGTMSADRGTVLVEGKFSHRVTVTGTTLLTSSRLGESVNAFSLPIPSEKGLIAVSVYYDAGPKDKNGKHVGFLLGVTSSGVDLENPWQPNAKRLGGVDPYGVISVQIDSKRFSSAKHRDDAGFVPDGSLLCRYLLGEIQAADVTAAAELQQAEESAVEKLKDAEFELRQARMQHETLENRCADYQACKTAVWGVLNTIRDRRWPFVNRFISRQKLTTQLNAALNTTAPRKPSVSDGLEE